VPGLGGGAPAGSKTVPSLKTIVQSGLQVNDLVGAADLTVIRKEFSTGLDRMTTINDGSVTDVRGLAEA